MKSFRVLLTALVVGLLVTALPASALNFHNGMIVIVNTTGRDLIAYAEFISGHPIDRVNMGQGRVTVNSCCYAAGSRYIIDGRLTDPSAQAHKTSFDVTPRLCNKDGIPYGYAVVEFYDGTIHYDHGFRNYLYPARRLDTACP